MRFDFAVSDDVGALGSPGCGRVVVNELHTHLPQSETSTQDIQQKRCQHVTDEHKEKGLPGCTGLPMGGSWTGGWASCGQGMAVLFSCHGLSTFTLRCLTDPIKHKLT